jgi:hypothetical protein
MYFEEQLPSIRTQGILENETLDIPFFEMPQSFYFSCDTGGLHPNPKVLLV